MIKIRDLERKEINIAIVGPVSAGKSTLMNTLFTNQYSDMKIKRTTMTPQVYLETNDLPENMITLSNEIKESNREINQLLIKKSENNETILYSDIKESKYFIPRVHKLIEMPKDVYLTIYDIPGLNDSKTKNIYFQYMNDNFYKFDIIIFVIDINSALNTSDEIDILNNIIQGSKDNYDNYDIRNKVIILANKCDNLVLDSNNILMMEDEYQEMFDQIKTIVNTQVNELFPQLQYTILPISCEDSYIYRMYDRDPDMDLDLRYINKFGYNQCGRNNWNRLSEEVRKSKIKKLMSEINIDEVLKLSGFLDFKNVLNEYLNPEDQIKYLVLHIDQVISDIEGYHMLDISNDINEFKNLKSKIEDIYKTYASIENNTVQCLKRFLYSPEMYNVDDHNDITSYFVKYLNIYVNNYYTHVVEIELTDISESNLEQIYKIKNNINTLVKCFPNLEKVKSILDIVNEALNNYYVMNIENGDTSIKMGLKYVYDLISNNFPITFELISTLFTNDDITNLNANQIIHHLSKLKQNKLIDKNELIDLCKKILLLIYCKILDGYSIGYITDDIISKYVYLVDHYWSNWDVKEVLIDDNICEKILPIKYLAKKMMVKCILHGENTYEFDFKDTSLILEEYMTKVIFDETVDDIPIEVFSSSSSSSSDESDLSSIPDKKSSEVIEVFSSSSDDEDLPSIINIKKPKKLIRKSISKCLKRDVWNNYVGEDKGTSKCLCCKNKDINAFEFHVGHVESIKNGGTNDIMNLRPICALCNLSMGSENMRDFIKHNCYGNLD
jgi:predicted GTPase